MIRKLVLLCAALLTASCAHPQIPPTNQVVPLTGTVPQAVGTWLGCIATQPVCSYVFSRATLAAGTTTCPPTTGTAYTPLNQASPSATVNYTDATASGLTVCYLAQTLQGTVVSQPSNILGPYAVPGTALPPVLTQPASITLELKPSTDVRAKLLTPSLNPTTATTKGERIDLRNQ